MHAPIQPFKLHWFQEEAIHSIYNYFQTNSGNPIVAMPTGTGKSFVIAGFVRNVLQAWPNQRFLMLTHVKELIDQNARRLTQAWPQAPLGIYSAGLNARDVMHPIIFGGVASVANAVELIGHRDLLLIDECHLVGLKESAQYLQIIRGLKLINPWLKVIGFTATPFRMGQGRLTEPMEDRKTGATLEPIFSDVCYDVTGLEAFNRLIAEGYLAPLIPKKTGTELDVSNVSINYANGDYSQKALQNAVDQDPINQAAVQELCTYGQDRRKWLVFASGIEHSEHLAEMLRAYGVPAAAIHSKISDGERDQRLADFRSGRLRALTNNNVLTTGFDVPEIDLIGMLRPTTSVVLWVQMLGRGTRPADGKRNCLVLDFAGNTRRLGPINDPIIPKQRGKGTGEVPVKICDACGTYNHTRATHCAGCGAEFTFQIKITKTADTTQLLRSDLPQVEFFDVHRVIYNRFVTRSGKTTLRVNYLCGMRQFHELIFLEQHNTFAGKRARDWWTQRHWGEAPQTVDEALVYLPELRTPRRIRVWVNRPYPEVLSYEF